MKVLQKVALCWIASLVSLTEAQDKKSEYLTVIDALPLEDLRETMNSVGEHGMNPKAYWTENMESSYQVSGPENPILKAQANEGYLRLLQHMSSGIVDPAAMGTDVRMQRKPFVTSAQLRDLLISNGSRARPLLENFAPQAPPYLALKTSLARLNSYCIQGAWPDLPPVKKALKLGQRNVVIPALKDRMRQFGYQITTDDLFDESMLNAVNDIQWVLKFPPDGVVSPNGKTWKYLNAPCRERLQSLRLNMEKLRWFPQVFEDRYIFINLAMSYFSLVDKTKPEIYTMSFRTINGRPSRKTPTMKDKIVYVTANPFWVVPPTIFREDKVEEIRNLPYWEINAYFASRHYEVWNRSFTRRIDPASIDWWSLDPNADANFYIRQKPNYMNALGVLKFVLTNSYAIYLHDTNQRELFADSQRLLSSGCIRLERPLDLAEYLLQGTSWTRELLEQILAKPGEVLDRDTRIQIKQPIAVYMVFLTSQLSSDGVLRFSEDVYKQNQRLLMRGAW